MPGYDRALRYVIGKAEVLNLSLGGDKDRPRSTSLTTSSPPAWV